MPTLDIALLHHPCAIPAEMAAVIVGPQGPPMDVSALPLATDDVPDYYLVEQAGVLVRATHAQMQAWFPGGGLPSGLVTVGGAPVTTGGIFVTVEP